MVSLLIQIRQLVPRRKQCGRLKTHILVSKKNKMTDHFASQDVNCWTGVVWIACGLLWCLYQLFEL